MCVGDRDCDLTMSFPAKLFLAVIAVSIAYLAVVWLIG